MSNSLYAILTFLIIGFTPPNKSPIERNVAGTWVKYNKGKVAEIFTTRPNHQFLSDLFDGQGQITGIEKGIWKLKGDSISFTFSYTVELKKDGTYAVQKSDALKPVTMPISIKNKLMIIGDNEYHKD